MDLYTIRIIKEDPNIYRYLRENSYWYKALNRDGRNIRFLIKEMKERYKLTTKDKLERLSSNINMIETFMDVLK
ncbi:MAG: hypothetical protein E7160_00205 [Firmicutes bacterium]|nr:hypothetical protein [Bacillota bacterium]